MKTIQNIILSLALISLFGCNESFLNLQPTNKVSADALFASEAGIKAFMANLYYQLPIEDFNFRQEMGFNYNPANANNGGMSTWTADDNGVSASGSWIVSSNNMGYTWWDQAYKLNRDINLLFSVIPTLNVNDETKRSLTGEASFMRAYTYFALARRYGGVPIITDLVPVTDTLGLYTPRSTEKATWDFVLASCDSAAKYLGDGDGLKRRATKWTAFALKSRAALHAASVAKYWNLSPFSGTAVDAQLVGLQSEDANGYYVQCISACDSIMNSGKFGLYMPLPANPDEAAINYQAIFETPDNAIEEVIFMKDFVLTGPGYGSNQDNWGNPNQTKGTWPHPGRYNPTLDLVDQYESYSNPGKSSPIVTTTDGSLNYGPYDSKKTYLQFNSPLDIFKDKDARLHATVILPMSIWKNTKIIIQGGLIRPNGTILQGDASVTVDGVKYYTFGASSPQFYSGFSSFGYNMTMTGFLFRKFLNQKYVPIQMWNQSTTPWIDFRFAEILLNYAEAVVESNQGDAVKAAKCINDLRRRAAHTTDIALTLENVLRERRVELVYENFRYWDLVRTRTFHTVFNSTRRHALVPVFDLRSMKYIFYRDNISMGNVPETFSPKWYYKPITGIGSNKLIQNPQY